MAAIDGQHDGTAARMVLVEALHRHLLEDPENFWDFWFETLNAQHNHYREIAERLLRSGVVNDDTTFADIPAIVAWDAAAQG
jgi:hypothetical protein